MSRLENLLERVLLRGRRAHSPRSLPASSWGDEDKGAHPSFSQIPWVDVVVLCIDHKLKDWQIPRPPVCGGEDSLSRQPMLIFRVSLLVMSDYSGFYCSRCHGSGWRNPGLLSR